MTSGGTPEDDRILEPVAGSCHRWPWVRLVRNRWVALVWIGLINQRETHKPKGHPWLIPKQVGV